MVLAAGFAPALAALSTSCLCCWTSRANEMDPPAGAAPAGLLYKRNPQAAAWRRSDFRFSIFDLRGCPQFGALSPLGFPLANPKSQIANDWSPHPDLHRADSLTERMHR